MKKTFLIFFTFAFSLLPFYAQPSITWNRLYDGGFYDDDYCYGLCKTTDGNFVLGGRALGYAAVVIKINEFGIPIWLKQYSGSNAEATTATNDGGIVLVSPTLLKINSVGDTVWLRSYPGNSINNLYDVIQSSDGGYFTGGRAYYDSGYVMKTDSIGNFQWKRVISWNIRSVVIHAVSEGNVDGYIVSGATWDISVPVRPLIAKYNNNGQRLWINFCETIDSLGGGTRIIRIPPYYLISCGKGFMKINDQGNVISSKLVPLDFNEEIEDMQVISNNRFVIVTTTSIYPVITSKIRIIDSSGNTLNSKIQNFSNFVRLKKIQIEGNGDLIFAGDAARYDTSQADFYALRCDSNLNFPPIKIKKLSNNIPSQFRLYQNYPNPFNPVTKINYELPITNYVRLTVYDILGKEITVLVNENQKAGIYEVQWDAGNYSSGVYFCRLSASEFSESKKMVLIK